MEGVVVDGVEREPGALTETVTEAITSAFAAWLSDKKKNDRSRHQRISVGHDSRVSVQELQLKLCKFTRGIAGVGVEVIQYGLASTPAIFNSTLTRDEAAFCPVDGPVMITEGGLGKPDIKDILERTAEIHKNSSSGGKYSRSNASSSVKEVDYMSIYTYDLVKAIRKAAGNIEKPLKGFHIVLDAGNAAGGFFTVLVATGFDISNLLNKDGFIEMVFGQQKVRLYIVACVKEDTSFAPQTKKEISEIA